MRVERPWGWFEDLLEEPGYKVKRLFVRSGQQLSLQRHAHRSESWTVVSGNGRLLCSEQWHDAHPGIMLSIPEGAVHRAQAGSMNLVILEVQHGAVLSEDDIERLQDDYGRVLS
ncbi:MAG: mannose-6-phosphate isomerase [Cyanobium sp. NAT70]|nr:mannose-6-phosphate isomerase [Cyanobium sp. NAT70]|tara:strand:- start:863 stop:1204 length:342 start_codon:yes stop_codon:yes gene_type:complete